MDSSLKDLKGNSAWNTKRAMRDQCVELLCGLDQAIALTLPQVQMRTAKQGFQVASASRLTPEFFGQSKANPGLISPGTERLLEYALYERYLPGRDNQEAPWRYLVHRQVPLCNVISSDGWGEIDLLGVTHFGHPVVVELKKEKSEDTPLHALLEAACYAISLKANWGILYKEIVDNYSSHDLRLIPEEPKAIPLVIAAPELFWTNWNRWSTSGVGVPSDTQIAFGRLCAGFAERNMPVARVSLSHAGWDEKSPLSSDGVSINDVVSFFPGWPT